MTRPLRWAFLVILAGVLVWPGGVRAQDQQESAEKRKKQQEAEPQPLGEGLPQRELTEKERQRRDEALARELESKYKRWLEEDVVYIITAEEREVFLHLNADEEREQFIEQFWLRRDPTPDTIENEFTEEHYRRIAYVNERFASAFPGWKMDRGRVYIIWGPPDQVEAHPTGGPYRRPIKEGGGATNTFPFEVWRYGYLEGIGQDVMLEFVDPSWTGEYRFSLDPAEKDAFLYVPGAGLSLMERLGLSQKVDRFQRAGRTRLPLRPGESVRSSRRGSESFERLTTIAAVTKPPEIKFKDLEALVTTRVSFNLLPFEVRTDFLRVTDESILVPITVAVKKKDMAFQLEEGVQRAVVNVFGRVTTLTGRIVQTFEDVIRLDIPPSLFEQSIRTRSVYQEALPLRPGLYKLNLVLKDLNSGNIGTLEQQLVVPRFEEDQLAHSSLILADHLERVAAKNVGSGQFVIGDIKVRPAVNEEFTRRDPMAIYLQVYNLGVNQQTHKPDALIEYTIKRGEETLISHTETTADLERASQQITLTKVLRLSAFTPGEYTVNIKVTDRIRQQTVSPSARFHIAP